MTKEEPRIPSDVERRVRLAIEVDKTKGVESDFMAYTSIGGNRYAQKVWGHGPTPLKAVMDSVSAAFISLGRDLEPIPPVPGIREPDWSRTD